VKRTGAEHPKLPIRDLLPIPSSERSAVGRPRQRRTPTATIVMTTVTTLVAPIGLRRVLGAD
jgi:hypothetical protein